MQESAQSNEIIEEKLLPTIFFSFDNLDILGVEEMDVNDDGKEIVNLVYVRGGIHSENGIKPIVMVVSENLLHEALDNWIKDKLSICKTYKHFCGAMGSISSNDYASEGTMEIQKELLNVDMDDMKEEDMYEEVPVFIAFSIDETTDMEHG